MGVRPTASPRLNGKSTWIAAYLSLVLGCTTMSPSDFRAKAPDVLVSWPGPVAVTPGKHVNPQSRLNTPGGTFPVDLDEFSAHLAELLSESLEKSGTAIGPGGKSIEIRVVYLDVMMQDYCYLDYTVTLGNGEIFGQQATGKSALFDRACRQAIEQAVGLIVAEPRTTLYLAGR